MAKEKLIFTQSYEVQDDTGTVYERGAVKEFEADSARHFMNRNAALPLNTEEGQQFKQQIDAEREAAKQAAKANEPPPELDQEKVGKIAEAIGLLDPQNEAHYTTSGKPEVRALADVLDTSVSGAERDAAFELFHKKQAEANQGGGE